MIREAVVRTALIAATRFLVGGHARWTGAVPSRAQRIYFANHGSHLDTILLWAALPKILRETTHPVAAADYWGRTPMRRFGSPVDSEIWSMKYSIRSGMSSRRSASGGTRIGTTESR